MFSNFLSLHHLFFKLINNFLVWLIIKVVFIIFIFLVVNRVRYFFLIRYTRGPLSVGGVKSFQKGQKYFVFFLVAFLSPIHVHFWMGRCSSVVETGTRRPVEKP